MTLPGRNLAPAPMSVLLIAMWSSHAFAQGVSPPAFERSTGAPPAAGDPAVGRLDAAPVGPRADEFAPPASKHVDAAAARAAAARDEVRKDRATRVPNSDAPAAKSAPNVDPADVLKPEPGVRPADAAAPKDAIR